MLAPTLAKVTARIDSGASGFYLNEANKQLVENLRATEGDEAITVITADETTMQSTHQGELRFKAIPDVTFPAYIFQNLTDPLLAVREFVDRAKLKVVLHEKGVDFTNDDNVTLLSGTRCHQTGLWDLDLSKVSLGDTSKVSLGDKKTAIQNRSMYACAFAGQQERGIPVKPLPMESVGALVDYWYQSFGNPVKSTFLKAVNGWLKDRIPGLTPGRVKRYKHRMRSVASAKGHMNQTRQGARSTTRVPKKRTSKDKSDDNDAADAVIVNIVDRLDMDCTAQLDGTIYMFFYHVRTNYIHIEPVESKHATAMLTAYKKGLSFYVAHGAKPTIQRMDNELSTEFREYLKTPEVQLKLDLVPPGQHRRNTCERAIQTGKHHIIATLSGADPDFPLKAIKSSIPGIEISLNLLRQSPIDPSISAYDQLIGLFDFNATPLGPIGCKVLCFENPDVRSSWGPHGKEGYYVGPALEHYRCQSIYISETERTRISDTVAFFPDTLETRTNCSLKRLTRATTLLTRAIAAVSTGDITSRKKGKFEALLHTLQKTTKVLQAKHSTAASKQRVSQMTTPAREQRVSHDDTVTIQQLPPEVPVTIDTEEPQCDNMPVSVTSVQAELPDESAMRDNNGQDEQPIQSATHDTTNEKVSLGDECVSTTEKVPSSDTSGPSATKGNQTRTYDISTMPGTVRKRRAKQRGKGGPTSLMHLNTTCKEIGRALMIQQRFNNHKCGAYVSKTCSRRKRVHKRGPPAEPESVIYLRHQIANETKCRTQKRDFVRKFNKEAAKARYFANSAITLDELGRKLIYTNAVKGPDKEIWEQAGGDEIIRLVDSHTGKFILVSQMIKGRTATYYNPRCSSKIKNGTMKHRVRGTAGGDRVNYDGDTAAHTASMTTLKLLLNAVVSDPGSKFASADIANYYLGTPLVDKHGKPAVEYMRIHRKHLPQFVIDKYDLEPMFHNDHVYMEIAKSIYGLPQAGRQSQDRLIRHLREYGYTQCANTPSLFKHKVDNIAFTLVVDDFGIKYTKEADLDRFLDVLKRLYTITEDREASQKYIGITINHDRENNTIDISMPGYIEKALIRFGVTEGKGAKSPATYIPPEYGKAVQYEKIQADTPISAAEKTRLQEIVGVLLYYARAVDPTMLCAVNKLASKQANPNKESIADSMRLLQYAKAHPEATIRYRPSSMQLMCHSDASYLSEAQSRSRAGGILFLGDPDLHHGPNGAIDCLSIIISTVVASAAEAEYAALFIVGQEAASARNTLLDLGFKQTATLIICDNQCAVGIATRSVKQKRSKAIAVRYHWIRDRVDQGEFMVTWEPGKTNLADFFTKNHPVHHHQAMRSKYLHAD